MPVVSVVMVSHRDTPFLRPAIASVLTQTFSDLELILVDNGMNLSPATLGAAAHDPRLRWVRLARNAGIPAGHNAGVGAARGEFIALLDNDDLALPHRLERQVEALRADPRLGVISSLAERIDESGAVTGRVFSLLNPTEQRAYTHYAAPVVMPACTGRREVFLNLPYRPEFPLAADFDFVARGMERFAVAALPEVLLHYRWHAGQATQEHAAEIERTCCVIRLVTARRRSGREEDLASALQAVGGPQESAAEACRRTAGCCLNEGFPVLAAYHARRSFVRDRDVFSALHAMRLGSRAVRQARGAERVLAVRMLFRGPVRALGVHPV